MDDETKIQTPKLNKAMVEARKAIRNPKFDSENPHFKSKFASLKAVIEATIEVAAEHGVAVHQDLRTMDGAIACYTHLCHESGEEKVYGPLIMNATKSDPQGYASASTYARRYCLMGVFGVMGDPDDDGNAASESAFTSVQARSKLRNQLLKAAKDGDDQTVGSIRKGMDNDQKAEMMGLINKPDQNLIQEALHRLIESKKEGTDND